MSNDKVPRILRFWLRLRRSPKRMRTRKARSPSVSGSMSALTGPTKLPRSPLTLDRPMTSNWRFPHVEFVPAPCAAVASYCAHLMPAAVIAAKT